MNYSDNTNVKVEFRIIGDLYDLEYITQELKIKPTSSWNVGDDIRSIGRKRSYTCWIYGTEVEDTLDINIPLKKVENLFIPKVDILVKLKE